MEDYVILSDFELLSRVFSDIISNSIKFSHSNSFIEKVHVNRIITEKKLIKSNPEFIKIINNLMIEIITY